MKKQKAESKKRIPSSGVLKIEPQNGIRANVSTLREDYPDNKKKIERRVADGCIDHLRMNENRDIKIISEGEAPDFACCEGDQEFGLELYELISGREAIERPTNLKYVEAIKRKLNKVTLYLQIETMDGHVVSPLDSEEGQTMVDEIAAVINFSEGKGGRITGTLAPWRTVSEVIGFMYHTTQGILGQATRAIYFSSTTPIGLHNAPIGSDYQHWESKLKGKWQIEYGPKCLLVLYTFNVRPAFGRLHEMINSLNTEYGTSFTEIWFSKPNLNGLDDVRNLFSASLSG